MKILTIIGARPQFIKASSLSRAILERKDVEEVIVHTGQHFDKNMSEVFFEELSIPQPKYNLGINSLTHGAMTGRMLEKIEAVAINEKPDVLLVYGDTNSTLAGAIAGRKMGIKIAHVEAGLRSYNMSMPEEINRILTDRISNYLFVPTETASENLLKEGFGEFECEIIHSGDVMLDSALHFSKKQFNGQSAYPDEYVLATVHREENTNNSDSLAGIIDALNQINERVPVVVPLHPRTRNIIKINGLHPSFSIIDPVGYFEMIQLIKNSRLVMTDSGGLQKEAYFFKKACITLRNETEWKELVEVGVNVITGSNTDRIISSFDYFNEKQLDFSGTFYGLGNAAEIILNSLSQ